MLHERPNAPFATWVDAAGNDAETLSYGAFDTKVRALAGWLTSTRGLKPGDRVLLVYPPGMEFLVAFGASLYAGLLPAPVAPPNPLDPDAGITLFRALVADCGASAVLSETSYIRARKLGQAKHWLTRLSSAGWPDLPWIDTARPGRAAPLPRPTRAAADAPFVLQYTSGSTSQPKGVLLTYGNLSHQLSAHAESAKLSRDMVICCWLPHFHDFFLISLLLDALFHGGRIVFFSPLEYIKRPALWFDVMHRHRATHTAAPNFAFDVAVAKTTPAQRVGWDLRSLEVVMSAAEPILPRTVEQFCEAFAVSGLSADAYCRSYGLAEHTVGATHWGEQMLRVDRTELERGKMLRPRPHGRDDETRVLVGCGTVHPSVAIRIVDPDTHADLGDDRVGEIWLDSPSKGLGFYGHPELSKATFDARLNPDDGRGWLRTGDLGALHRGELFVTGRIKEMLITRGRNLYPHDLEDTARHVPGVRPGGVCAFAIEHPTPGFGLLVETTTDAVGPDVLRALRRDHRAAPEVLLLGQRGATPKTTSGKLQRARLAQLWRDQAPSLLRQVRRYKPASQAPTGTKLDQLCDTLAAVGRIDRPHPDQALDSLPLGSLEAIEVVAHLRDQGVQVELADLLQPIRIRDLAARAGPVVEQVMSPWATAFQEELIRDSVSLPGAHEVRFGVELRGPLHAPQEVIRALGQRHPLLTARFVSVDGRERIVFGSPLLLEQRQVSSDQLDDAVRHSTSVPIELRTGPLASVHLYALGAEHHVLQLRLHHTCYDATSSFLVLRELVEGLAGKTLEAPEVPFAVVSGREQQRVASAEHADWWRAELEGAQNTASGPVQGPLSSVPFPMGVGEDVDCIAQRHGGTAFSTLLTAYQLAIAHTFDAFDVTVGSMVSTRDQPGVRDVVGPCVHYAAFRLRLSGLDTLGEAFTHGAMRSRAVRAHATVPLRSQVSEAARSSVGLPFNFNHYPLASFPDGEFVLRIRRGEHVSVGPLQVAEYPMPTGIPAPRPYTLMLTLADLGGGPIGHLRFSSHLLTPSDARALVDRMASLLRQAALYPAQALIP